MKKLTEEYVQELVKKFDEDVTKLTIVELTSLGTHYRQQCTKYRVQLWVDKSVEGVARDIRIKYETCTNLILQKRREKSRLR